MYSILLAHNNRPPEPKCYDKSGLIQDQWLYGLICTYDFLDFQHVHVLNPGFSALALKRTIELTCTSSNVVWGD